MANNAQSHITPDNDAVVTEVLISAPPERVFQALIDPTQLAQWWTSEECPMEFFNFEPRLGGRWSFASEKSNLVINGVSKFEGYGEVTEFDPPRVLAYSWIANWHLDKRRASTVRWELTRTANGTQVKVTHSDLVHEDVARADYAGGWIGVVEQLRKFLE